jgi:hypothetical protein
MPTLYFLHFSNMHIIEEQEFCEKVYPILTKVFDCKVPFSYYFSSSIQSRLLAFDTSSASINDAIPMQVIIDAARKIGDDACFFSIICPNLREPDFYHVPLADLELYYNWFNNNLDKKTSKELNKKLSEWGSRYPLNGDGGSVMIFSESSKWGTITKYCEKWGLVGGIDDFIYNLKQEFPQVETQVFSFLFDFYVACHFDKTNYLEQIISAGIKDDLDHVYGIDKVEEMLAMTVGQLFERSGMEGEISEFIDL